jgi:hypothetical protein
MANDDLSEEIQLLRTQLEELQKQQDSAETQDSLGIEDEPQEEMEQPVPVATTVAGNGADVSQELVNQFRDLLDSIDKDIKDAKPTTLLIVFALGVLVGRL